jgi:nitroreductase/NAD-dependent dihydropyrimidine dehydrogenase PreA subunit
MKNLININSETCKRCGLCGEVCPNLIMEVDRESGITLRADRLELCFQCGHCMAICPTQSIQVAGLSYETDFFDLPKGKAADLPFVEMVKSRRAIRAYKDRPVEKEVLKKIVKAITFAPPSITPLKIELAVVQDAETMRKALPEMINSYDRFVKAMNNPVGRLFIRFASGADQFRVIEHHVIPMMSSHLPELKQGLKDTITRNAPAMIIFHAHRMVDNYETDVDIAMTYGLLAAHSLGLGCSPIDLVPNAIDRNQTLRELFMIPDENTPVAALIIGYPKYRYRRGIKREFRNVTWIGAETHTGGENEQK